MFPADLKMPMVAPADVGRAAAERLLSSAGDTAIEYVEGPACYSPNDVADAFAAALGREVTVSVAPREAWEGIFKDAGFSAEAASAYARMTAVSVEGGFDKPDAPRRGAISLDPFIRANVTADA